MSKVASVKLSFHNPHSSLKRQKMRALTLQQTPYAHTHTLSTRRALTRVHAFRRPDLAGFAQRAWRTANDSFEVFVFESRKTAERIDRKYAVSRKLGSVARGAADRVKEIDREFEIGIKVRNFGVDFRRNWPKFRKQISSSMDTPLGRSFATIFFLWFALSGWLFRFLITATFILPFAGPFLIRGFANRLVVKGSCPACKTQFVGLKNQTVRCTNCGNIVWQPRGENFSGMGKDTNFTGAKSEVIDVEFEEK